MKPEAVAPEAQAPADPPGERRGRLPIWLRAAVSLLLVVALVLYVDLDQVGRILAASRPDVLAWLVALVMAMRILSAYRWYLLMRTGRPDIAFMSLVRISLISVFAGNFLPGGVGAEAVRIYGAARASSDLALAFSSAVVERAFGLVILLAMVAAGLSFGPPGLPEVLRTWSIVGLIGLAIGAWLMMARRPRARVTAWLSAWPVLAPVNDRLRKLYARFDLFAVGRVLPWTFVLSFLLQLGRVMSAFLAARALHVDVGFLSLLVILPAAFLVSILPISIGGLGLREGTMVSLLGMMGVAPAAGFSLSVLLLATNFVTTLPGAVFLAQMRAKRPG